MASGELSLSRVRSGERGAGGDGADLPFFRKTYRSLFAETRPGMGGVAPETNKIDSAPDSIPGDENGPSCKLDKVFLCVYWSARRAFSQGIPTLWLRADARAGKRRSSRTLHRKL